MPHDRDGSVDRLLREALGPRSAPSVAGPCFDAETAAAWADGTLSASEQAAAEAHAANCVRCQTLLAAIAKTAPAGPSRPWWRARSAWWLVPVTAALAGVLVWGLTPRHGTTTQSAQRAVTSLDNVASATSMVSAEREKKTAKAAEPQPDQVLLAEARVTQKNAASLEKDEGGAPRADEAGAQPVAAPAALADRAAVAGRLSASLELAKTSSAGQWRVGQGGAVQRSVDGGSSWQTVQPGDAADSFAALSSPSPNVCWLVGVHGTVFLTVDGRTWQRIGFSETADLVSVRAIDETTATVTAADGRTFTTTNRGSTWAPVP